MTRNELRSVLALRFATYREWSYSQWVDRIELGEEGSNEHTAEDGTTYQFEVQAFWDDHPLGKIRVCAYLCAEPQQRLLGFLPIYTPDVSDGFIMSPDGTLVGENPDI